MSSRIAARLEPLSKAQLLAHIAELTRMIPGAMQLTEEFLDQLPFPEVLPQTSAPRSTRRLTLLRACDKDAA